MTSNEQNKQPKATQLELELRDRDRLLANFREIIQKVDPTVPRNKSVSEVVGELQTMKLETSDEQKVREQIVKKLQSLEENLKSRFLNAQFTQFDDTLTQDMGTKVSEAHDTAEAEMKLLKSDVSIMILDLIEARGQEQRGLNAFMEKFNAHAPKNCPLMTYLELNNITGYLKNNLEYRVKIQETLEKMGAAV